MTDTYSYTSDDAAQMRLEAVRLVLQLADQHGTWYGYKAVIAAADDFAKFLIHGELPPPPAEEPKPETSAADDGDDDDESELPPGDVVADLAREAAALVTHVLKGRR